MNNEYTVYYILNLVLFKRDFDTSNIQTETAAGWLKVQCICGHTVYTYITFSALNVISSYIYCRLTIRIWIS